MASIVATPNVVAIAVNNTLKNFLNRTQTVENLYMAGATANLTNYVACLQK